MGKIKESLPEEITEYDEQYQVLKKEHEKVSEEYEKKKDEYTDVLDGVRELSAKMDEIETEKMEGLISKAYDKKIKEQIGAIKWHNQSMAEQFNNEFQEIKEDEKKEVVKKQYYKVFENDVDVNEKYIPPEPSIESRKKQLYDEIEKAHEKDLSYSDQQTEQDESD